MVESAGESARESSSVARVLEKARSQLSDLERQKKDELFSSCLSRVGVPGKSYREYGLDPFEITKNIRIYPD